MKRLLRKLAVRTKLLSSFMLLASFVLILGVTAIFIQQALEKNQKETLASINLADAFFEAKYFLRSDMHIYTELVKTLNTERLNYWWGEHDFQILFFNDQLKKIETEFLVNQSFDNDTLQLKLLDLVTDIREDYHNDVLPLFIQFKSLKESELRMLASVEANQKGDSAALLQQDFEHRQRQQKYAELNKKITEKGLQIILNLDKGKDLVRLVINEIEASGKGLMKRTFNIFLICTILGVFFSISVAFYISKLITVPVNKILHHVNLLGRGEHPEPLNIKLEDEFGAIQHSLNTLTDSLVQTSHFSKAIGEGKFDSSFTPMSQNDILGNSLLQMRDSLNKSRAEEESRRLEDEQRSWAANGIGKFGDIMRHSGESLKGLSYKLISNLVDYVDAVQGALFVMNDENTDDVVYDLIAAIAYDRDKLINKSVRLGEGLVGRVLYEEKTIYLKEVPDNYVSITSGMGTANPNTILLVPLKFDGAVIGVIELISFNDFAPFQIEFIEKVGENIASFIASIKVNEKTASLLNDSQHKSEELAAQEEEMRQNMEELQATQEEAARREEERTQRWEAIGKIMGIVEMDMQGTILDSNNKVCQILGMEPKALANANFKALFFKNATEDIEKAWSQLSSETRVTLQSTWTHNGDVIKISHELTKVADLSGKGNRILAIIQEEK